MEETGGNQRESGKLIITGAGGYKERDMGMY